MDTFLVMYQISGQNLFLCHGTPNFNCTLNKISNWSLFKFIISDQALITLDFFCLDMCGLMGKSLAVFQKSCLSIHVFLLKMQKYAFLKKNGLSEVLYQI